MLEKERTAESKCKMVITNGKNVEAESEKFVAVLYADGAVDGIKCLCGDVDTAELQKMFLELMDFAADHGVNVPRVIERRFSGKMFESPPEITEFN